VIVGSFKAAVSRRLGIAVWQRNYYEHIIRTEKALDRIRGYIEENPRHWSEDRENMILP
jgi:REP element-mobilizing transposase RayT